MPRSLVNLAVSLKEPGGVVMPLSGPPMGLGASLEGCPATVAVLRRNLARCIRRLRRRRTVPRVPHERGTDALWGELLGRAR